MNFRSVSPPARRAVLACATAVALAACAVGPDYRPPSAAQLSVPADYPSGAPQRVDPAELRQWWTRFDDPVLAELVERAMDANLDVAAAEARLRAARASLTATRAAWWPALGASVDASSRNVSDTPGGAVETWQAGFDAAWEIDIFGGTRRAVEAAAAGVDVAGATLQDVRSSIAAEVALNYIDARSAQQRLQVARESLASQDETVRITGWRHQAGLVSAQDVEGATVLRAQTAAAVPQLRATYVAAANRIATLLGEAPGGIAARLDADAAAIPLGPDAIGAGVPAELLRRRPDLVAAERAVAAEVARIGVAQAELYPALRLGGSLTSTSFTFGDLGRDLVSAIGGSITVPLFQGGQLRARVEGQRAAADAALAGYENAVLQALEDVDNAMQAIIAAQEREQQLEIAQAAAERSVALARTRYQSGLIDFQSLLDAERSLLSTRESRLNARAARAGASVQLYKALGGGWPSPDA
jgi:NodT family efflux transporter outer membrane factor (OMF) lipoprotein